MIEWIRSQHPNVLVLDCGDNFDTEKRLPRERAEAVWSGLARMGYDAVNVAEGELAFGDGFFLNLLETHPAPAVSANLRLPSSRGGDPLIRPFIIKEFGTLRVGVIGVTKPHFFTGTPSSSPSVDIAGDEAAALAEHLPELRRRADIVVLLSHLGLEGTRMLLESNAEIAGQIDVAIAGHGRHMTQAPEAINRTLMVQASMGGEYLGRLVLDFDAGKKVAKSQMDNIALTEDGPEDPQALEIMQAFHDKEREARKEKERALNEAHRQEQMAEQIKAMREKYLKMTPEEFVETMKKEGRAFPLPGGAVPPSPGKTTAP